MLDELPTDFTAINTFFFSEIASLMISCLSQGSNYSKDFNN